MLSLFFVLSPRGDTIISKDYRGDSPSGAAESFFRKVKFWGKEKGPQAKSGAEEAYGSAPPIILIDGMTYVWVKRYGLMFACNTRFNASASLIIELLNRMIKVFKDYCGVLTEEAIRKNFILIYELLDEVVDFGYAQGTSTENLKTFIYNEPVLVDSQKALRVVQSLSTKTQPSSSVHKPISGVQTPNALAAAAASTGAKTDRNEIFVDILERLTMLFAPSGSVIHSSIDGAIQMKSYLAGNPELRLALNEDLVVGKGGAYGSVVLDDCNFHECVRLDDFESNRLLSFFPPDGEFVVLNYRCTGEFRAPFRVLPSVDELSPFQLEVVVVVRADVPETNYGANVTVTVPVPRSCAGATVSIGSAGQQQPGQTSADYDAVEKKLKWHVKKFQGGQELSFRAKVALSSMCTAQTRKEVGPVSLAFEIPMYNVSNLQVKYLRIAQADKSYNPYRWVRYVTKSSSYVCRT
mmetsp:Transcript_4356/g.14448  ORF Transcript_4356/g.14448 Transcript_4356/m.14448 type:complete len:465 (+) Transcript_4356:75-1469(+)